jgi:hypothetical protein
VLDDARTMMEQTGQRGCEPEVHRVGALLAHTMGAPDDVVVAGLVRAVDVALDGGSVLLATRALDDLLVRPGARTKPAVRHTVERLAALAPGAVDAIVLEEVVSGAE